MSTGSRRAWLQGILAGAGAAACGPMAATAQPVMTQQAPTEPTRTAGKSPLDHYPPVVAGRPLQFGRDHGAHPDYRTEWWYLTGWLDDGAEPIGFQITFFRTRTRHSSSNPSRFAPAQLLFAHAGLARASIGRLLHDQRAARAAPVAAEFSTDTTDLRMGNWHLRLHDDHRYTAAVRTRDFDLALELTAPDAPWLQGESGYSRKGPRPEQASYYYSRPQLQVRARLVMRSLSDRDRPAPAETLRGLAWLDHEWSSEILDPAASGWDWVGLNMDNGQSLMGFVIRPANIWSHAALREPGGAVATYGRSISMQPQRTWTSPRTAVQYPVSMQLQLPGRSLTLEPLLADQELDSRASTGAIYWEGAVRALENGRQTGRGYLELTGYGERLRL